MNPNKLVSKEYVFKQNEVGALSFVGDFEGFYQNEADPWGQKGADRRLKSYYTSSRRRLSKALQQRIDAEGADANILEVGCGLGYAAAFLASKLPGASITGMDVSPTAIAKAKLNFPNLSFSVGDICSDHVAIDRRFDILILNEILWYILGKIDKAFENAHRLLNEKGILIISNAFLKEQKYGKEIIDGFDGMIRYTTLKQSGRYQIIKAEIDDSDRHLHHYGQLLLKKRN